MQEYSVEGGGLTTGRDAAAVQGLAWLTARKATSKHGTIRES